MARLEKLLELKSSAVEESEAQALSATSRLRQLEATLALAQPLLMQACEDRYMSLHTVACDERYMVLHAVACDERCIPLYAVTYLACEDRWPTPYSCRRLPSWRCRGVRRPRRRGRRRRSSRFR